MSGLATVGLALLVWTVVSVPMSLVVGWHLGRRRSAAGRTADAFLSTTDLGTARVERSR